MNKKISLVLTVLIILSSANFAFAETADVTAVPGWNAEHTVYLDENLNPVKGIALIDGIYYSFSDDGILQKDVFGTNSADNKLYYFNASGKGSLYTGIYNGSYYVEGTAKDISVSSALTKLDDGKYYYITASGTIFKPSGSGIYKADNGRRYYFYSNGSVEHVTKTGIRKIGKKAYYFNSNSSVKSTGKTHFAKISGKTYRISSKGYLLTGWQKIGKNKYYMSKKSYARIENKTTTVSGHKYWFGKTGKVITSKWKYKNGSRRYYFDKKGRMLTNTSKKIGKYVYFFNKNGVLQRNLISYKGYNWVLSHPLKIGVNRTKNTITIYAAGSDGKYNIPVKAMICTVGSASRPTDKGTFSTGYIYRWKDLGGRTEYQDNGDVVYGQYVTHFYGAMYFHSVCYTVNGNNHTLLTGAYNWLGNSGSHGCVRLKCSDAKIIYNLAARQRCKVVVYDSNYAGPFGKPKLKKIPSWQNYDPTDTNA